MNRHLLRWPEPDFSPREEAYSREPVVELAHVFRTANSGVSRVMRIVRKYPFRSWGCD